MMYIILKIIPQFTLLFLHHKEGLLQIFLSNYKDHFLIEICENEKDLILQKFKMYKLRSEIELSVSKGKVYLISNNLEDILSNSIKDSFCFNDPRFENLFLRDSIFSIMMLRKYIEI